MLQEIVYMDRSVFRGESFLDEETHFAYKEG